MSTCRSSAIFSCPVKRACSSAPRCSTSPTTPNFGLPVADLNSANFGRIFSAAAPRLLQFGVKLIF